MPNRRHKKLWRTLKIAKIRKKLFSIQILLRKFRLEKARYRRYFLT